MPTIPQEKLNRLVSRWETLQTQLASGTDHDTFVKLSKEFAELDPLVAAIRALQSVRHERDNLRQMIEDPASEPTWSNSPARSLKPLRRGSMNSSMNWESSFCRRMRRMEKRHS